MSRYQKGKTKKVKTNLNLLEQEIVSGSGICWARIYWACQPWKEIVEKDCQSHNLNREDAVDRKRWR